MRISACSSRNSQKKTRVLLKVTIFPNGTPNAGSSRVTKCSLPKALISVTEMITRASLACLSCIWQPILSQRVVAHKMHNATRHATQVPMQQAELDSKSDVFLVAMRLWPAFGWCQRCTYTRCRSQRQWSECSAGNASRSSLNQGLEKKCIENACKWT